MALLGAFSMHARAWADEGETSWRSVQFRASKWGLTARSSIERSETGPGPSSFPGSLDETRKEALVDGPLWHLLIESRYVGRASTEAVWLDRRGAIVFSHSQRRSGRSSYWNERRYQADGIHRHRRAPASRHEADEEAASWTETKTWIESYPVGWQSCAGLTEAATLLHILSSDEDLTKDLCFLSRGSLWHLELKHTGQVPLSVDYLDKRQEPAQQVRKVVQAQRIEVTQRPIAGNSADDGFRLLGLKSGIVIYLDPGGRFPLRLSGRAPTVGHLVVNLTEVR